MVLETKYINKTLDSVNKKQMLFLLYPYQIECYYYPVNRNKLNCQLFQNE